MKRLWFAAALQLCLVAAAWGAEPLVGTWQLEHQELNGQTRETERVTLRISQDGDKYLFAFSVPVNNIDFVSMSYTAKLDGSEADVKNARGVKVGTVQITSVGHSQYKLILKGEHRPESKGRLTVSADGKSLTSESETTTGSGQTDRLVQSFSQH